MSLQPNIRLPEDHIKLQAPNIKAYIGDNELGNGILAISERLFFHLFFLLFFYFKSSFIFF